MMSLLVVIVGLFTIVPSNDMSHIRDDFHDLDTDEKVVHFINMYENSPLEKSEPYVAAAIMKQAEYTFFPHKKLYYFNQGKKRLELYINENLNCIEGRYVRVLVQSEIPAILGYKSNIKSDQLFIAKSIVQSNLPKGYQQLILKNMDKIK